MTASQTSPDPVAVTTAEIEAVEQLFEFLDRIHELRNAAGAVTAFVVAQRAQDWTDTGVRAANYEPSTFSPGQIDISTTSTVDVVPDAPPRSDRTGEAAIRPDTLVYTRAIPEWVAFIRSPAGQALTELVRSTRPSDLERDRTDRPQDLASTKHRGAGTCEACAREITEDDVDDDNRIVRRHDHDLCKAHYEGARRANQREIPTGQYIAAMRAEKGLPPLKPRNRR